jgi:hypothetical protein
VRSALLLFDRTAGSMAAAETADAGTDAETDAFLLTILNTFFAGTVAIIQDIDYV